MLTIHEYLLCLVFLSKVNFKSIAIWSRSGPSAISRYSIVPTPIPLIHPKSRATSSDAPFLFKSCLLSGIPFVPPISLLRNSLRIMRNPPCQLRIIVIQEIFPHYLYSHWKRRFKIEDSPVENDSVAPQFRQIIKSAQVSGLSMTSSLILPLRIILCFYSLH